MKKTVKVTVLYVGSSLLSPLREAGRELNRSREFELQLATHNAGDAFDDAGWRIAGEDLADCDVVFIIHVTDPENAARIVRALDQHRGRHRAVIAINCLPGLMRQTRMGGLSFSRVKARAADDGIAGENGNGESSRRFVRKIGSWVADYVNAHHRGARGRRTIQYLKLIQKVPALLKLIPSTGRLGDFKRYLAIFCYFLQPTPSNVRSMLACAIKHYVPDFENLVSLDPPESLPALAIYHPDAPRLFEDYESYARWYAASRRPSLDPPNTIGLLLLRPAIVSGSRKHYDHLIHEIEREGLGVIPAISSLMDNRQSCDAFFVDSPPKRRRQGRGQRGPVAATKTSRVSQIVSLTGFSFVGGPAMNDSAASVSYLKSLGAPLRSAVSLDLQTIESWELSMLGLNPVQSGMQVAIPEIDGATEPHVYGGIREGGEAPQPIEDRCRRLARRLKNWNRLQTIPHREKRLAFVVFCFPPNKGNAGTAADLDVFPSVWKILASLQREGYSVELPASPAELRARIINGNAERFGTPANVQYRMHVDEYLALFAHAADIEKEWGRAPGRINALGNELLILGAEFGNVFIGIQPTFGYEGDPMRMLMAKDGAPHHGFAAFYSYIEKIFRADAAVHVGTHGALEFMPGKQAGLSHRCWPDRLIGDLPNLYIYSVNNPSEGAIAKRRSYAGLISYLTPPLESAGVYKALAEFKELLLAYRQSANEEQRRQLFLSIEESARALHLNTSFAEETARRSGN